MNREAKAAAVACRITRQRIHSEEMKMFAGLPCVRLTIYLNVCTKGDKEEGNLNKECQFRNVKYHIAYLGALYLSTCRFEIFFRNSGHYQGKSESQHMVTGSVSYSYL